MDKKIKDPEGQGQYIQGEEKTKDSEKTEQAHQNSKENFEKIMDYYLAEASKGEEMEAKSVHEMKELLRILDEDELLTFFDEILLRIPDTSNEKKENTTEELRLIKRLFTVYSGIFKTIYCAHLPRLYPVILKISEALDLSRIPLFSTDPKVALYGYKEKLENSVRIFAPLKADQIIKILNAEIAAGRLELAEKWICEIASYSKAHLCDAQFETGSLATHKELKKTIQEEPRYRALLSRYLMEKHGEKAIGLLEKNSMIGVMNASLNKRLQQNRQAEAEQEEKKAVLQAEVSAMHRKIADLTAQVTENEHLCEQMRIWEERHTQQVLINEELQRSHCRQKAEYQEEIERLLDKTQETDELNTRLQEQIEQLKTENQNLKSDLIAERGRTRILREDAQQVAAETRKNITQDFVNLLSEPINHFLSSFAYFKDTEKFDPDTLDICQSDLSKLMESMESFDARPIGHQGETVAYDRSLHFCEDRLEAGEQVRIVEIGWTVHGNVILKATTEKVEE